VRAIIFHSDRRAADATMKGGLSTTLSLELDPHRKLAGGTEDRSDSFGGGELPWIETPSAIIWPRVLPGLADRPIQCLLDLTPTACVAQHP
jgi:hypothetical protein